MTKTLQIAIDGPVAAGKGTIARLVAERLGYFYVDTGAMYRVAALISQRQGIDLTDEDAISALIDQTELKMRNPLPEELDGRQTTVILNGEDVSWQIRTEAIGRGASKVALLKKVRQALVKKQQQIAADQNVIMEGRDITFRVLPHADLKIYLTANEAVRAKRRLHQLLDRGLDVDFDTVFKDLKQRDRQDMERSVDPLTIVPDAWVLDTTDLTIDQVVDLISQKVSHITKE